MLKVLSIITSHCEGADEGSYEGERKYGANVPEKIFLLHGVTSVEYYWWQQNVKENLWVEGSLLVNLALLGVPHLTLEVVDPGLIPVLIHADIHMSSFEIELVRGTLLTQS